MTTTRAEREVVRPVLRLSPFFISYAHAGSESNRGADRFYHELRDNLQPLVSPRVGTEMGFIDIVGLTPGVRWRHELAAALGTCQVLVALLSVPYLESEWCGKEWHAFTMRDTKRTGTITPKFQGPIIPVRWAPIPFELPRMVGDAQMFRPDNTTGHPDLAERYDREGLLGLLHRGHEEAFKDAVWDLAMCIQQIYYCQELLPREFDPDELRNVFEGGVP